MTLAIEDIPTSQQLDREALTAVRGGLAEQIAPAPWNGCIPEVPSVPAFPSDFPFNRGSPVGQPNPPLRLVDPQNPLLQ